MAKQTAEYKITIQGPEGKEVIEADAFVLATHKQSDKRRVVNLNSNVKAGFPTNDTDEQAAERLFELAEQLEKDVPTLAGQLVGEDAEVDGVEAADVEGEDMDENGLGEEVETDENEGLE